MKYLTDYMQEKQTEALNKAGAFFAFSEKQYNEQRVDGVVYNSLPGGLLCPEGKAKELLASLDTIYHEAIKQDIAENGIDAIIKRELANHECYYTGDIDDCIDKLVNYPVTAEQILEVFLSEKNTPEVLANL